MAEAAPAPGLAMVTHGAEAVDLCYWVCQHAHRQHLAMSTLMGRKAPEVPRGARDHRTKKRSLRTQRYQVVVALGFAAGLLAADLGQSLLAVTVATHRDVLDSSRVYRCKSALRRAMKAERRSSRQ
jgi:hypothetical protein